jgi:type I restriction enzyme S subunit
LIADVVTGKLDVCEAAARLPKEVKELEPFEEINVESDLEEWTEDLDEAIEEVEA